MVEFITKNVAAQRIRDAARASEQSDLRRSRLRRERFDLDDATRRRDNELARDEAFRRVLQGRGGPREAQSRPAIRQGSSAPSRGGGTPQGRVSGLRDVQAGGGPPALQATPRRRPGNVRGAIGRELAGIPGSGALAAKFTLQELDAEQKVAARMFELAATGNPQAALAFAEQQSLEFPKEFMPIIQDRAIAKALSNGMKTAAKMFEGPINAKRRQEWFMQFARSMLTEMKAGRLPGAASNARFVAASQIQPELPAPKPGVDVPFPEDVEKQKLRLSASRGRRGGRMSVFEQKRQAWLSAHPGDEQGALEYAQGRRRMNRAELLLSAQRLAVAEARGAPYPGPTRAETDARTEEIFQRLVEANAFRQTEPEAGAATSTPDPDAAGRTPAPNFKPVPGAPRSEAERPAPTAPTSPRASRRPKVGDEVTANGRKLRVMRVRDDGRIEVEDPTTGERFLTRVR